MTSPAAGSVTRKVSAGRSRPTSRRERVELGPNVVLVVILVPATEAHARSSATQQSPSRSEPSPRQAECLLAGEDLLVALNLAVQLRSLVIASNTAAVMTRSGAVPRAGNTPAWIA